MFKKLFGKSIETDDSQNQGLDVISVIQATPADEEIIEEWHRECPQHLLNIYRVMALKHKYEKFQWAILFNASDFVREEPFASMLSEKVYDSISQV